MKKFVENLISRLEEKFKYNSEQAEIWRSGSDKDAYFREKKDLYLDRANTYGEVIRIVNQLAEEYKHCIKSSCSNCEVYDKEKHYCPKWCEVIKGTVEEIKENNDNDFCEWQEISVCGITVVKEPHRMKLFNCDEEQKYCPYCGKKIKVVE